MTLNFKQPKYILPLFALPFLALFFYVYQSSAQPKKVTQLTQAGINSSVGDVSDDIKKKELADKLEAYRNAYKEADGYTAVSPVPIDKSAAAQLPDNYSAQQKRTLDSINGLMKQRFNNDAQSTGRQNEQAMIAALNQLHQKKPEESSASPPKEPDPMAVFRQQMALMDSVQKANDPEAKAEAKKKAAEQLLAVQKLKSPALPVKLLAGQAPDFNTVMPGSATEMMTAVIDENITGYAGSRLRLRLLQDIGVGTIVIPKGTYLYALISGFSEQRVTLQVRSIFYSGKLLPVKLDIYDLDGLPGLYIPASAFRDFTKDLGTNTIQGVTLDGSSSFVMSTAGKMFESTSSAIAGMIRKDKAKLKYNSYIYLIDSDQSNSK